MTTRLSRGQRETLVREYSRTREGDIVVTGSRSAIEALAAKGYVENVRSHPGTGWLYAIATVTEAGLARRGTA